MLKIVIALLALPATTCLAQTGSTASPKPISAESDKSACRSLYATGSIMSTRVCHKRTEWAALDAANQKMMDNRRNSNTVERSQGGAGDHTASFGQ